MSTARSEISWRLCELIQRLDASAPVAAALSNAVFDATGVRLRTVPFRPERVLAALAGRPA